MKKKKVLFIIWSFTYGGGAEKILANLINNMDLNKYEIDVLEYLHNNIKVEKVNKNINILNPIIDITDKSLKNRIKNAIISRLINICPRLIRKIYLNKKYDYEISFNYLIPTFLLDYSNSKTICWVHTSIYDLEKKRYQRYLQRKMFKKANKIVAISDVTYKSIIDLYPNYKGKTTIVSNGFVFEDIYEGSKTKEKIPNIDLLYCGRLEDRKDPLKLIEISKILKEKKVDFKLGFLGQGVEEEKIRKKIKEYCLEENVIFFGFQKNPYPYINKTKILCMTSKEEGFPTVIIEAMTLGKPFVTTKVAGVDEMYDNEKCGFITNDNEKYSNYIIKLLTDNNKYNEMSNNCKKYVRKFSVDNQVKKLEMIMDEV